MRRFRDILKEANLEDLILLFHENTLPTEESMADFLGVYYKVLKTRVKLSNMALLGIDHDENKGDKFYGINLYNLENELTLDYDEVFELDEEKELDVTLDNISAVAGLYIPDSFSNHFGNNFLVLIMLKALLRSGQAPQYDIDEDYVLYMKEQFNKTSDVYSYRLRSDYKHLKGINNNEYFLMGVLTECHHFKEKGSCTKRSYDKDKYEVDWAELLSYTYRYYEICPKVFSENSADPHVLYELQNMLINSLSGSRLNFIFQKEDHSGYKIRLLDSTLPDGLPEVDVIDPDGNINELCNYDFRQIVKMPIEIISDKITDYESIVVLLLMYIQYPCRMRSRRQRDEITKLLGIWQAYSDENQAINSRNIL